MGPRAMVALAAALSLLASAPPAAAGSLQECGQRVIRDWYSGARVDKVYPLPCYREAIRALPDDVLQYTDASADIERALEQARRGQVDRVDRSAPAPVETHPSPRASVKPLSRPSHRDGVRQPETQALPKRVPARRAPDTARVASAPVPEGRDGGLPYPLLALAALAPILLVSGLVGALGRRGR